MKSRATMLAAMLLLAGAARAGAPAPAGRAQRQELREALRADKGKIKRLALDQHKELVLLRDREKSDLRLVRASAARGETLHAAILEVRERSRRQRLDLRARGREERRRLRRAVQNARERIVALRRIK